MKVLPGQCLPDLELRAIQDGHCLSASAGDWSFRSDRIRRKARILQLRTQRRYMSFGHKLSEDQTKHQPQSLELKDRILVVEDDPFVQRILTKAPF